MLRDLGYLPFTFGEPEQPPASIGYDVAQVRDGQIAVLYTLLNGLTGLERGLDGGRDELRCLCIDDDVPAQQHAADDLPGVRERAGRANGRGGGTGGIGLGHIREFV